ncbi:MAG TPA: hypothetical protein VK942_17130 [Actinomycetes bacterium]|nr:hypothetical protein [Actinomycetes bacterium]
MSGRDGPTWGDDMDAREEGRRQESYMDGLWLTRGGGSMGSPPSKGGGCGTTLLALLAGLAVVVAW